MIHVGDGPSCRAASMKSRSRAIIAVGGIGPPRARCARAARRAAVAATHARRRPWRRSYLGASTGLQRKSRLASDTDNPSSCHAHRARV
jgi:hypothetical protein